MTETHNPHQQKVTDEKQFIQAMLGELDATSSTGGETAVHEAEIAEAIDLLETSEAAQFAIDALLKRAKQRHPGFIDLADTEADKFAGRALIETSTKDMREFLSAGERLLEGKNPAVVVRAGEYDDFDRDILGPLQALTSSRIIAKQTFPNETMVGASSELHLDNFIDSFKTGFRYDFSVSQINRGNVLFMAGLASNKAKRWGRDKYFETVKLLNDEPAIRRLYDQAKTGASPAYREITLKREGVDVMAVALSAGDVAIWPQGGLEGELPAWHAFREVGGRSQPGFEPRQSTSYHLG